MKTITKAALSLFVCALFALPQVSLAGKPVKDCTFQKKATDCAGVLLIAYEMLVPTAFKNERDFTGLSCKVAQSDLKLLSDKPADAERKLSDSVVKIDTLFTQGKIDDYDTAVDMAEAMEDARACAYKLAYPNP